MQWFSEEISFFVLLRYFLAEIIGLWDFWEMKDKGFVHWAIIFTSLLGLGLAVVSIIVQLQLEYGLSNGPTFCSISESINCETVYLSKWSKLFGVSLGAFGVPFYLLMIFFAFADSESKRFSQAGFILSCISCILSIYLFLVSKIYIGSLCIICIGMYLANFLIFGFFTYLLRKDKRSTLEKLTDWIFSKKVIASFGISSFVFIVTAFIPPYIAEAKSAELIAELIQEVIKDWESQPRSNLALKLSSGVDRDYLLGNQAAPIQVVEFIDYECPFCRELALELKNLRQELGQNELSLVIKNYPLDKQCNTGLPGQMHLHSCYVAEAVRCAGEQELYWEMSDEMFTLPELEYESTSQEVKAAVILASERIGLDAQAFEECMDSDRQLDIIKQEIQTGDKLGLQATPSVWVNGKQIALVSSETLRALFEHILASK
ncbi:MAG: thioredoxin domain-containing protein [Bdellovibrionota bacterium]